MRNRRAPLGGLLAGFALTLVIAASAGAYSGEVAATISGSSPSGPQPCETPISMSATVQDIGGKLIEGQPVAWAFVSGNIAGDVIASTSTTTNAGGVATTTVTFACSARTVTMSVLADAASGSFVTVLSGAALPRTDALASSSAPASSIPLIAFAALAVLLGSATILLRLTRGRR
jgi:hypothetical protein